jgi:hypothetical protein
VFANGKESSNIYDAPNLVNELPAKIYKKFIKNKIEAALDQANKNN